MAVLGSMLMSTEAICDVLDVLSGASDFYDQRHGGDL